MTIVMLFFLDDVVGRLAAVTTKSTISTDYECAKSHTGGSSQLSVFHHLQRKVCMWSIVGFGWSSHEIRWRTSTSVKMRLGVDRISPIRLL